MFTREDNRAEIVGIFRTDYYTEPKVVVSCPKVKNKKLTRSSLGLIQSGGRHDYGLTASLGVARVHGQLVARSGLESVYVEGGLLVRQVVDYVARGAYRVRARLYLDQDRELLGHAAVEAGRALDVQSRGRRVVNAAVYRSVRMTWD